MTNKFGRIMLDIESTSLSDEDKFVIKNKHVGGIIFFSRNFESYEQIKNLIIEIKNIKENIIFAVDHEGGRVQRFKNEFTKIPSMQEISLFAKKNSNSEIFKEIAWLSASELISAGIDINFAPVLDLDKNSSSIIGDRAFSNEAEEVIKNASFFIDGMNEAGMSSTGKHFPGHGGVIEDSHKEMPTDNRSFDELDSGNNDLEPYRRLSKKLDAVMCAHILFPKIDEYIPSFSNYWLKDFLRNELNYRGLVLSDDLTMLGAGNDSCHKKVENSLKAGCDMVLICNDRNGAKQAIDFMENKDIKGSVEIAKLKSSSKCEWSDLDSSLRAKEIKSIIKEIGDKHEKNRNRS